MMVLMTWWGALLLGIIFLGVAARLSKRPSPWHRALAILLGVAGILLLALGIWAGLVSRH